jgi:hypothetical protein
MFDMKKAIASILLLATMLFAFFGCRTTTGEGFAIYLTAGDVPVSEMPILSHVNLADKSLISGADIISYLKTTHEIQLTDVAYQRIVQLEVPVNGRAFVVCVDRKPIYWGAFWTPISSISFDGVTIWKPLSSQEPKVITLNLGYPSSSYYGGEDPRNNPEVMESLEQAGKLIDELTISDVNKLPHSMKGYELYSWSEDDQWHFTLITGTNRNKTLDEITSEEDSISEAGWIKGTVIDVDAVKNVLSKLPQDEFVIWLAEMRDQTEPADIKIQLPPEQTTDAITAFAGQCGLDFSVTIP